MKKLCYTMTIRLTKMLNIVFMTVPLLICWELWISKEISDRNMEVLVVGGFVILYAMYGKIYDSFLVSISKVSEMIYSQCLAAVISDFFVYVILCLIKDNIIAILPMLVVFGGQILLSAGWCITAHIWYFKTIAPKKSVIIHTQEQKIDELIHTYDLKNKFSVQHILTAESCMEDKLAALQDAEILFLCGVQSHERNVILKYCVKNDITVYVLPRIGDLIMSGAQKMHLFHMPFLKIGRYEPSAEYLFLKRMFDILVSALAILLLSPIMLLISAAIKLTDGGPVFYKQKRLTKDGKEFFVIKFRSMRTDAEKDGIARLSTGDSDQRITPIGKVIRKIRMDELPQLFNILEGSMSLVGPRPERPEIAQQYEEILPEFALRLQAKAGLTGYAQVYGKYNSTPYDKLKMDLMYIANPSILEDLRIIFATIKILFIPESTEGVEEGMENAIKKSKGENEIEI